jgi:hypothetical protein
MRHFATLHIKDLINFLPFGEVRIWGREYPAEFPAAGRLVRR